MSKGNLIVSGILCCVYAGTSRLVDGHWPKSWVVVLIFVGLWVLGILQDGMQTIFSVVLEIKEQAEGIAERLTEIEEKVDQMGETIDRLDDRIPGRKSVLDEY